MGSTLSCFNHRVDPGSEMPFWKKEKDGEKERVNFKAKLEHKQYLAQESPEPIYDLSECGLKNVPPGVYSRCKITRKQALLLQDNELVSLNGGGSIPDLAGICLLDLHNNSLEKLPEDIGTLSNLTTLNVENNKLKQLPSSLGSLKLLVTLNLAGNCLKELPSSISDLTSLRSLDLRENPKLSRLPVTLCRLRRLECLLLDQHITFPSPDILNQGTEAVMRFLCKECDIEYISPSQCLADQPKTNGETKFSPPEDPYLQLVSSHLAKAELIKEQKKEQHRLLEQQLTESQEVEARSKQQNQINKKKLLEDMAQEETKKDEDMKRIQKEKEEERTRLFLRMSAVEKQTDVLINELMAANSRYSDPKKVMAALEAERQEMEKKFTIHQQDVDKLKQAEVLRSMSLMMEDEFQREATRRLYEKRQGIVLEALNTSLENDKAVEAVLVSKGKQQNELISKLLEDEKYQREAFQSLLLQQDHRSQEISGQMDRIQSELASLTIMELKKRDLKVEFEMEVLRDKRETLTKILLDLIQKKKERADDLQDLLGDIEKGKSSEQDNYWLIQYQKLLESKPQGILQAERELQPQVKSLLEAAGAEKFIPIFGKKKVTLKQLSYADHKTLRQYGIDDEEQRNRLLLVTEQYLADQAGDTQPSAPLSELDETAPSAPTEDNLAPSAPVSDVIETFKTGECVVCLERKSEIIFLPCGHLCSCSQCEQSVDTCPLCRSPVLQRVRLG